MIAKLATEFYWEFGTRMLVTIEAPYSKHHDPHCHFRVFKSTPSLRSGGLFNMPALATFAKHPSSNTCMLLGHRYSRSRLWLMHVRHHHPLGEAHDMPLSLVPGITPTYLSHLTCTCKVYQDHFTETARTLI